MGGTPFGPYRILAPIGSGGLGEVYRAHDDRLQQDVALKFLDAARAGDDDAREALLREARVAAALHHPLICTIYDVGEADGQAYIAMELVDGQPLDRAVPGGGLHVEEALAYGVQIADAVAHAHESGIVHRNLKTANVMVTADRRIKVLDFGLAQRLAQDAPGDLSNPVSAVATKRGHVDGTLDYMSPEQLRGQPATFASDVWALGVVLYEMVAGSRPFGGRTSAEVASAICAQHPRALPNTVPTLLRGVIARCLAKEPSARYRTAAELRAALGATLSSAALPRHVIDSDGSPAWQLSRRARLALLWSAVVMLALLLVALVIRK